MPVTRRSWARRSAAVLGMIAAAALAGCGSSSGGGSAASPLTATQWVLDSGQLGVPGGDGVSSWIQFDGATATGSDGCNSFHGGYTLAGETLRFGPLAATQKLCTDPYGAVAARVQPAFAQVTTHGISGSKLELKDAGGAVLLTYRAVVPSVEGSWTATSILYDDAIRGVIGGTTPTAVFGGDGNAVGSGGCNAFRGRFSVQGSTVKIGPLSSTRKACATPDGIDRQEAGYLTALESARTFQQVGDQLTLLDGKGRMAVVLTRAG